MLSSGTDFHRAGMASQNFILSCKFAKLQVSRSESEYSFQNDSSASLKFKFIRLLTHSLIDYMKAKREHNCSCNELREYTKQRFVCKFKELKFLALQLRNGTNKILGEFYHFV